MNDLSTFEPNSNRPITQRRRPILDAVRLTRATSRVPNRLERWALETQRFVPDAKSKRYLRFLALALLLSLTLRNVAHPDVIHLPFRTVQSMILVQAKVNGKPVTFLLEDGSYAHDRQREGLRLRRLSSWTRATHRPTARLRRREHLHAGKSRTGTSHLARAPRLHHEFRWPQW